MEDPAGQVTTSYDGEAIASADAAVCSMPLPFPVRLGTARYARRDYLAVRVTDVQGREGFAFGYTRNLPLLPMVHQVLEGVVGTSPRERTATIAAMVSATPSVATTAARARSLAEIALWDLAGKQAGLAIAEFFGVYRTRVPAMAVAGYFRGDRSDAEVVEEVRALEAAGFRRVKLMLGALDSPATLRLIDDVRAAVEDRTSLVVDAHYSFASVEAASTALRELGSRGVSLLEDPFLPTDWRKMRALPRHAGVGIAVGEDVSDPAQYLDLLEVADVLRIDPTTCGGIRAAVTGIESATIAGVPVLPHVFTSLSGQLASAFPAVSWVEFIPPATQADPMDGFLEHPPTVVDGELQIDLSPGAGTALDWPRLMAQTKHAVSVR